MVDKLPKARRKALIQLESILGNECYNASIQNYGPGGIREADGDIQGQGDVVFHQVLELAQRPAGGRPASASTSKSIRRRR